MVFLQTENKLMSESEQAPHLSCAILSVIVSFLYAMPNQYTFFLFTLNILFSCNLELEHISSLEQDGKF